MYDIAKTIFILIRVICQTYRRVKLTEELYDNSKRERD